MLAFLARWALHTSAVPQTKWVGAASLGLTVITVGFALLFGLALLVVIAPSLADIATTLRPSRPLLAVGIAPSRLVLPVDAEAASRPPILPSLLLEVVIPQRDRGAVIGDLEETYRKEFFPKYGRRAAVFVYWARCLREVAFYSWPVVRKYVPWGVIAGAVCTGKLKWLADVLQHLGTR